MTVRLTIKGIQRAQRRNLRRIAALEPRNARQKAIKRMAIYLNPKVIVSTPHDTGSLRASHRIEVKGARGRIYVDPHARNPRSNTPPHRYAVYLHEMGHQRGRLSGFTDFYAHTVEQWGDKAADLGADIIAEEVENA